MHESYQKSLDNLLKIQQRWEVQYSCFHTKIKNNFDFEKKKKNSLFYDSNNNFTCTINSFSSYYIKIILQYVYI